MRKKGDRAQASQGRGRGGKRRLGGATGGGAKRGGVGWCSKIAEADTTSSSDFGVRVSSVRIPTSLDFVILVALSVSV